MRDLSYTRFFGLQIVSSGKNTIEQHIRKCLLEKERIKITTMNAQIAYYYLNDETAREAIGESVVIPDGTGLSWAIKRMNGITITRYPGVELMKRICEIGNEEGLTSFFLGGAPGVAKKAAENLSALTGISVAGTGNGFFDEEKEASIVEAIRKSKTDILFVGLGAPKQEKWINEHFQKTGCTLAIGVGGSLDIYAKTEKRAPGWVQKANLEWLYRIAKHPLKKAKVIPQILSFIHQVRNTPKQSGIKEE